jgi:hypothetical protein
LLLRTRTARVNLRDSKRVRTYIRDNIDRWYEFARRDFSEEQAPEGSLVLVYGCDKTESWAAAAFTQSSSGVSVSFNGGMQNQIKLCGSWSRIRSPFFETRDSDKRQSIPPSQLLLDAAPITLTSKFPPECKECVFVRVFKCWRRIGLVKIPKLIRAGAGPSTLPGSDGDAEMSPVVPVNADEEMGEGAVDILVKREPDCDLVRARIQVIVRRLL